MAPLPKPPGTRERRNQEQAGWVVATGAPVPEPPAEGETLTEAVAYWNDLWAELGGMFAKVDRHPIWRAACLHGDLVRGDLDAKAATAAASELRQLEDRLGISPRARRQLQWELAQGTGKVDPDRAAPRTDKARERRTPTGRTLTALTE